MQFLWVLALNLFTHQATAHGAQTAARAFEHRYQRASTLKAAFFEHYSDGHGGSASESGTVYFSRPGRMRWDYQSPEQKLFLVDGANVWFYVPADRTASRAKLKQSSDWRTPLALLAGRADLAHLCRSIDLVGSGGSNGTRIEEGPAVSGDVLLRCLPRTNAPGEGDLLREVLFETDDSGHLVRVVIREAGNVETEFRFGNWEENLPLPEATFHFAPPPGVTIVDEATLAGAMH